MGFRYINQDSDKMKKLKEINKFAEILGIHTFTTLKNYFYKGFKSVNIYNSVYYINDFYNVYKYILCKSFYNLLHIDTENFYLFKFSNIINKVIKIENSEKMNNSNLPLLLDFNFFNSDIIQNNDCDNKLLNENENNYANIITNNFNNIIFNGNIRSISNDNDIEYYKFTYKSKEYSIIIYNLNNYLDKVKEYNIFNYYYTINSYHKDPNQTSMILSDDLIKKDIIYKLLIAKLIYDMEEIIKKSKKTGGMNNKSYQLYIINDRYFINYNKKRVYLTIKNTYKNNNQLFIKINKNTHIKIKII